MDTEKRSQLNLARATSERTCPQNPKTTVFYRKNKPIVSLPQVSTKFPKCKLKIPKPSK